MGECSKGISFPWSAVKRLLQAGNKTLLAKRLLKEVKDPVPIFKVTFRVKFHFFFSMALNVWEYRICLLGEGSPPEVIVLFAFLMKSSLDSS